MTDFHVTQEVIEALTTSAPDLRITQAVAELLTSNVLLEPPPPTTGQGHVKAKLGNKHGHTNEHGAVSVVAVTAGAGTGPLTPFAHALVATDATGALTLAPITLNPPLGPLTDLSNLRVCTDENEALLVAVNTAGATLGPLTNLGNLRARTDARGSLVVTSGPAGTLTSSPSPLLNLRGRTDENGALVVTGLSAPNAYRNAVITDGAFAYWRFTETTGQVLDSVGTAHGTITGTLTRGLVPGAILSDPTDPAIRLLGAGRVDLPSITMPVGCSVEAWVRNTLSAGTYGPIWTNRTSVIPGNYFHTTQGPQFLWGSNQAAPAGISTDVNNGLWHHLVGTYDGTNLRAYVNGVLQDTRLASLGPLTGLAAIGWDPFVGFAITDIDELALYAVVLTPTQVAAHYTLAGY